MLDERNENFFEDKRVAVLAKELGEKSKVGDWTGVRTVAQINELAEGDAVVFAMERHAIDSAVGSKGKDSSDLFYELVDPEIKRTTGITDVRSAEYFRELQRAQEVRNRVAELRQLVLGNQIDSAKTTEELGQALAQAPELAAYMRNSDDMEAISGSMVRYPDSLSLVRAFREKRGELVRSELVNCNTVQDLEVLTTVKYPELQRNSANFVGVRLDEKGRRPLPVVEGEELYPTDFSNGTLNSLTEAVFAKRTNIVATQMDECRSIGELNDVADNEKSEDFGKYGMGTEVLVRKSQEVRRRLLKGELVKASSLQEVNALYEDYRPLFEAMAVTEAVEVADPVLKQADELMRSADQLYGASGTVELSELVRQRRGQILLEAAEKGDAREATAQDPELSAWIAERVNSLKEFSRMVALKTGIEALLPDVFKVQRMEEKMARRYGFAVLRKLAEKAGIKNL
jgi:hypothetical protein